jgi:hypothetical protein
MFRDNLTGGMSMSVFGIATSSCVIRGGFRGGRAGRAPPLKFLNTVKSDFVESFKSAVSVVNH